MSNFRSSNNNNSISRIANQFPDYQDIIDQVNLEIFSHKHKEINSLMADFEINTEAD